MNSFSTRLLEARKAAGYANQESFAKVLKIPQQTYGNYESGRSFPKEGILREIGVALGVSIDSLLGIEPLEAASKSDDLNVMFRDFMSYFHKRKSAAIAYNEMLKDYSRDGKVLPSGFSLINLCRYAKRIASEKFKTIQPDDMPERCVNCEQLFQQFDQILLNLCETQKPCKNCDLLVTK